MARLRGLGRDAAALLYAVLTWLTAVIAGIDLAAADVAASAAGLLPVSLLYGGLAIACAAVLRRPGAVTGLCGALLVIGYLANTIALLVPELDWLHWLTPFHCYGSPIERGIDVSDQLVLLAGTAALTLAALPLYARRDIRA